jgi:hypothetical protein
MRSNTSGGVTSSQDWPSLESHITPLTVGGSSPVAGIWPRYRAPTAAIPSAHVVASMTSIALSSPKAAVSVHSRSRVAGGAAVGSAVGDGLSGLAPVEGDAVVRTMGGVGVGRRDMASTTAPATTAKANGTATSHHRRDERSMKANSSLGVAVDCFGRSTRRATFPSVGRMLARLPARCGPAPTAVGSSSSPRSGIHASRAEAWMRSSPGGRRASSPPRARIGFKARATFAGANAALWC